MKHWSFQAQTEKYTQLMNPKTLKPLQKRVLWAGLRLIEPDLADMLMHDETLKLFMGEMDAELVFKKDSARAYYAAGLTSKNEVKTGSS